MSDLAIAVMAGALLGASAHRAGLCTVKAVTEVVTTRRAHFLWSFVKASLWTAGILALAAAAGVSVELGQRPVLATGIAGGVIFGLGAGLNGACSFSTLSRLAEGHLVMLFTLAGWALAIVGFQAILPGLHLLATQAGGPGALAFPLLLWMLWESWAIFRRRAVIVAGFRAGVWALSLSVLLIAIANSALLLIDSPWSFTSAALCGGGGVPIAPCDHPGSLWAISAAALATMTVSALLRRSFRLRWPKVKGAVRHLAAGLTMGVGASLIPGGNDGLILFGLPSLSPHALPIWLAIVAGISLSILVMRAFGLRIPKISCDGDVCRSVA